jgi:predicted dehydrogenase
MSSVPPAPAAPGQRPGPLTVKTRVALIGCGTVGELHRDRLLPEPVQIVAVSDPDSDALSRMAASVTPRPRLFRSEQDLLAAGLAEAAVICTPHSRHAEQVEASLEAGVHVLCEKPFVTEPVRARALVDLARAKALALFVAYTRRSRGHARFLLYAAGRIGPLSHVQITRTQPWRARHGRTWRMHRAEGGGFLLDNGASMLDLLLRIVDSPVSGVEGELTRAPGADVDVRASVRLSFLNGVRAELSLLGDATEETESIRLFGERGTAGWSLREDAPHDLYLRPAGGPSEAGDPAGFRTLLPDAAFVAALRSGRSFGPDTAEDLYDAATALPVVDLVDRIYATAVWR